VRFVQRNLAAARAARPVWLDGPLFAAARLFSQLTNKGLAA
jgi:hypothetical protein